MKGTIEWPAYDLFVRSLGLRQDLIEDALQAANGLDGENLAQLRSALALREAMAQIEADESKRLLWRVYESMRGEIFRLYPQVHTAYQAMR